MTLPAPGAPETLSFFLQIGVLVDERDWVGNGVVVVNVAPVRVVVLRRQPSVHQSFFLVHVFGRTLVHVLFPVIKSTHLSNKVSFI